VKISPYGENDSENPLRIQVSSWWVDINPALVREYTVVRRRVNGTVARPEAEENRLTDSGMSNQIVRVVSPVALSLEWDPDDYATTT
jgi:hypothetical protein